VNAVIRSYTSAKNRIGYSPLQILVKLAHNNHSKFLAKAETQVHEQQQIQLLLTNRATHLCNTMAYVADLLKTRPSPYVTMPNLVVLR